MNTEELQNLDNYRAAVNQATNLISTLPPVVPDPFTETTVNKITEVLAANRGNFIDTAVQPLINNANLTYHNTIKEILENSATAQQELIDGLVGTDTTGGDD